METESLNDILHGSSTPSEPEKVDEVVQETEPQPEPQPEPEAEKKTEKPELSRRDVAAIIDERRKRQELEAKLKEYQNKPQEKPSVFEDEDKAISVRLDEGTRTLRETLFKQSVKLARMEHKDAYAEAETAFMEAAEADPRLYESLRNSDDPGEYIYHIGLQIKELSDVGGDFIKYREKVSSQYKVKLSEQEQQIAALKAENEALKKAQQDLETLPRSLNKATSVTAPKIGEQDPEDIKSIVRFK